MSLLCLLLKLCLVITTLSYSTLTKNDLQHSEIICEDVAKTVDTQYIGFCVVFRNTSRVRCEVTNLLTSNSSYCTVDIERFCYNFKEIRRFDYCSVPCPNYYRCQSGDCVERSTVCDGNVCGGCNEDDEWESGIGFQCVRNGKMCKLPQQLLLDNVRDCDQGEDLCYHSKLKTNVTTDLKKDSLAVFDNALCFKCLDGSVIVPRQQVCDGIFQCSDLSDECLCEINVPELCNKIQMRGRHQVLSESESARIDDAWKIGKVLCGNGTFINRSFVCDSVGDCFDNADERNAYCGVTLQCKDGIGINHGEQCRCAQTESRKCNQDEVFQPNVIGTICDGTGECPPHQRFDFIYNFKVTPIIWPSNTTGYAADECEAMCENKALYNCTAPYYREGEYEQFITPVLHGKSKINFFDCDCLFPGAIMCDGEIECSSRLPDHDELNCTDRYYCKSGLLVSISTEQICDGVVDCDDGSDEAAERCRGRFFCPSLHGAKVSIPNALLCDYHINCDDKSDEVNCSDERFYCENGNPLFVLKKQRFDGRRDCTDFSDECPTLSKANNEDVFSSRYHLIANPIFRALVWLMGLLSIVGNMAVVTGQMKQLKQIARKGGSIPLKTNVLLVLNLALADILMGFYLISLGIAGISYSGEYCLHKVKWMTSSTCSSLGVLAVLSSEASVITLASLTSCRLYGVYKPFQAKAKPTTSTIYAIIVLSWVISLLLAFFPFLPNFEYLFVDKAVVAGNPFFQNATVAFDSAKLWAEKVMTFDPSYASTTEDIVASIHDQASWQNLQQILQGSIILNITHYFGYYSASGVCLPRLFVTKKDSAWAFSLLVTIFNFLSFIYVAVAYCFIVLQSRKQAKAGEIMSAKNRQHYSRLQVMQKKVLRLIVTDFCCWVPISIMVFINFFGFPVGDITYVLAAIVLLPINSALNPLLYSDVFEKLFKRTRTHFDSTRRRLLAHSQATSTRQFSASET